MSSPLRHTDTLVRKRIELNITKRNIKKKKLRDDEKKKMNKMQTLDRFAGRRILSQSSSLACIAIKTTLDP